MEISSASDSIFTHEDALLPLLSTDRSPSDTADTIVTLFALLHRVLWIGSVTVNSNFDMEDLTTQRQSTQAFFRQSEPRLQRIAANISGIIYQFLRQPDGTVAFPFVSSSCRNFFDLEATEIQANAEVLLSLIHPEDVEDFDRSMTRSVETLEQWCWEGRFILPSGRPKWVQAAAVPERQTDGAILWDGLLMDVTARKQAEEALRQAREELELKFEERMAQLKQANEQLQFTQFSMDRAPEAIFWMDRNARFFYVNEAACRMLGYSREELLSMSVHEIDPNFPAQSWLDHWRHIKSQGSFTSESTNRAKDGRIFPVELSVNYLEFNTQEYNCVFVRDISPRKRAEQERDRTQRFLNSLLENLPVAVFAKDAEQLNFIFWNKMSTQLIGYSTEAVLGKNSYELFPTAIADFFVAKDREVLESNQPVDIPEEFLEIPDRGRRLLHTIKIPIFDEAGNPQYLLGITEDITERHRAKQALQQSEAKFRSLVESANGIIYQLTVDGIFSYVSPNWVDILGHELSEVEGRVFTSFVHPDDLPCCLAALHRAVETGEKQSGIEYRVRHKDGVWRWHASNLGVLQDPSGGVVSLVGIARDISDRKFAEEALRESEERFRNLVESTNDLIWEMDENAVYTYVSPQIRTILGYEVGEVLGKTPFDFMPPDEACRVFDMMSNRVALRRPLTNIENQNLHQDGRLVVLETSGVPFFDKAGNFKGYRGIDRDITKRKQTEQAIKQSKAQLQKQATQLEQTLRQLRNTQAQLIQTEKMSSLGQLVAGIAHEINNPVNFIYGNINHARRYTSDLLTLIELYQDACPQPSSEIEIEIESLDLEFIAEDFPRLLDSMEVGTQRIREIVGSLRNFSRFDEASLKEVDIHQGIDSTLMLLHSRLTQSLIPAAIQVVKEYGDLPLVECYPGHLNQVFMNLLTNAIDALDEAQSRRNFLDHQDNPSTIWIRTEICQVSTPNPQIVIRIADNGMGMTQEILARAFDPFFTTKPVGSGTGLGLAISYQIIVELHKGQLECNSSPGAGTELIVKIPIRQSSER